MPSTVLRFAALALSLLALSGCTAAYRMSYLRANFQAMDSYPEKSQAYLDSCRAVYGEFMSQTRAPNEPPYPAMKQCLSRMEDAIAGQKAALPGAKPARDEFEKFAAKREDINEKDPDWQAFLAVRSRSETAINGVGKYTGDCATEAAAFNKLMQDNGVEKLRVEDAKHQMQKSVEDVSARVDALMLDTARTQTGLMGAVARGLDPALALKEQSSLERLDKKAGELKGQASLASDQVAKFRLMDFGGRAEVWTGPGMVQIPGRKELKYLWQDTTDAEKDLQEVRAAIEPKKEEKHDEGGHGK